MSFNISFMKQEAGSTKLWLRMVRIDSENRQVSEGTRRHPKQLDARETVARGSLAFTSSAQRSVN